MPTPTEFASLRKRLTTEVLDPTWVAELGAAFQEEQSSSKKLAAPAFTPHPVGILAWRGVSTAPEDFFRSNLPGLLRIGALADDALCLLDARIDGAEDRFARLMSRDHEEAEATAYEIYVAASLLRAKNTVRFIAEVPGRRSVDIEANAETEIECKRKFLTNQEQHRTELWELLYRRWTREAVKLGRSMVLDFVTKAEPTREQIDLALKKAREFGENSGSDFKYSQEGIQLQMLGMVPGSPYSKRVSSPRSGNEMNCVNCFRLSNWRAGDSIPNWMPSRSLGRRRREAPRS